LVAYRPIDVFHAISSGLVFIDGSPEVNERYYGKAERQRVVTMSTAASRLRRDAIRDKLMQCAGRAPDTNAIAAATVATWPQVVARLEPVIGVRGIDALFMRALHLTSRSFPCVSGDVGHGTAAIDAINARLRREDASTAAAASYELLFAFTELLADLIGESLTDRLLAPVWALPGPASQWEKRL
jgi:hypothetical protein